MSLLNGVNAPIQDKWTALLIAIAADRKEIVDVRLSHGALGSTTSEDICTSAIRMAIGIERCLDPQLCETVAVRLFDEGVDVQASHAKEIWRHTLEHGDNDSMEVICRLSRHPTFRSALSMSDLLYQAALQYLARLENILKLERPESVTSVWSAKT
jgi:hypothetical protein